MAVFSRTCGKVSDCFSFEWVTPFCVDFRENIERQFVKEKTENFFDTF